VNAGNKSRIAEICDLDRKTVRPANNRLGKKMHYPLKFDRIEYSN